MRSPLVTSEQAELHENKGNILFLFPPLGFYSAKMSADLHVQFPRRGLQIGKSIVPPLGVLYLASILTSRGYAVEVIDFTVARYGKRKLEQLLVNKNVVGISVPSYASQDAVAQIIRDIRTINASISIVIGGTGVTLAHDRMGGADVMVLGEAELIIAPLMDRLVNGYAPSNIPGVIWRDKDNGTIHNTPPTSPPEDLDALQFPDRQIVNVQNYQNPFGTKCASIITARGCPFRCKFCVPAFYGNHPVRKRSAENVLAEIQQIAAEGYDFMEIVDQDFLSDKRRAHEICDGILSRGIKLMMTVQGRMDRADADLYRKMRQAGVRIVYFGLESGNQDTLDFYERGTTVENSRRAVKLADECGLYTHGSFILGAPIESEHHLARTIAFAKALPLDSASFNVLHYTRGSPLWNEALQQGLIKKGENDVIASRERGLGGFGEQDLKARAARAACGFYLRPAFVFARLCKIIRCRDFRFAVFLIGWSLTVFRDLMADRFQRPATRLSRGANRGDEHS